MTNDATVESTPPIIHADVARRPGDGAIGRGDLVWLGVLAVAFVALYAIGTGQNYVYADDSLKFIVHVHDEPRVFVHHLMLWVLNRIYHAFAHPVAGDYSSAIALFKGYVAVSSGVGLFLVGWLSLRWFGRRSVALLSMAAVGFSYGYWSYSIITDLYVPAIAAVLAAIAAIDRSYDSRRPLLLLSLAALAIAFAALNHQAYALLVAPAALVLLLHRRNELAASQRWKRAATLLGLTALLGVGTFGAAYVASGESDPVRFVQGYTAWMPGTPYDAVQWKTPVYALLGIARAIGFPEYALRVDELYARAHATFPLKELADERYLVREIPSWLAVSLVVVLGILLMTTAVVFLRAAWIAWRRLGSLPPAAIVLISWAIIQALFFSWWEASSNEFWIWLLPCLGVFLPGLVAVWGKENGFARVGLALYVGLLFLLNAPVVGLYWTGENCLYRVNKRYLDRLAPRDLALTADFYNSNNMTVVFHSRTPRFNFTFGRIRFDDTAFTRRLDELRTSGGSLYIDPMVAEPDATELLLSRFDAGEYSADPLEELRKLEEHCRRLGIPLYAVEREGGGVLRFERRSLGEYVRWVEAASIGTTAQVPNR